MDSPYSVTSATTGLESILDTEGGGKRWWVLGLLATVELLGMSVWFTAGAAAPSLRALWGLSAAQASWLTTLVQLGFVAGTATAALLNLADLVPARRYVAASALLAAAANAAILLADDFTVALFTRFMTGFFLAGVYPPAMKMAATWFRSARGFAIGTIVGALTLGKAMPFLIAGLGGADYRVITLAASAAALASSLLVVAVYRDGPYPFPRRPFDWRLVGSVLKHRPTRLAIGGYLGHMWELYAMWTLITLFFFDYFRSGGASALQAGAWSGVVAFGAIGAGSIGSMLAGISADRVGRARVAIWSMLVSGTCALTIGWLTFLPPAALVALALVWGFAIVADSAQFSALVTELAPPHAVGTALTLQTSLGFLLTAFSIWLAAEVSTTIGWGAAFTLLALGPALGIVAMRRLPSPD